MYDLISRAADRAGLGEQRRRLVAALEGEILEIGAGTGATLAHYERTTRLVALEPDASMAKLLRPRAAVSRIPVEVVEGSAESLPFADESFDHVVATLVLCSVADLDASLAEVRRVLRPGGSFHFLEHVRGEGRTARWQDRLTPLHRRVAGGCHLNRDTAAAIRASGLHVERLEPTRLPGHPLIRPAIAGSASRG